MKCIPLTHPWIDFEINTRFIFPLNIDSRWMSPCPNHSNVVPRESEKVLSRRILTSSITASIVILLYDNSDWLKSSIYYARQGIFNTGEWVDRNSFL